VLTKEVEGAGNLLERMKVARVKHGTSLEQP